jgi:phosphoribosyl-dephospho-CoA transferase
MANQTSRTSQKQSTPHSIGRLMDADFFGGRVSYLSLDTSRESVQCRLLVCQTDARTTN